MPDAGARLRLKGFLGLYGAFIVLASLYPLSGWTPWPHSPLEFVSAPWPRYITRTDLATNLLTYVPLGYAAALAFARPQRKARAVLLGAAACALLSLACEVLQLGLPRRIASNLDWLVNSLGALLGALLSIHHARWLRAGKAIGQWRARWFHAGPRTGLGLALLGVWLLAQFALVPLPGIGVLHVHLRPIDLPPEGVAGINGVWFLALFLELTTLGALTGLLLRPGRYVGGVTLLLLVAFVGKLIAAAVLLKLAVLGGVLSLETVAAFVLALWLLLLPLAARRRAGLATLGLLAMLALHAALAERFWPDASLLNIVGLAKHLGVLWPLLGLAWLAARRAQRPAGGGRHARPA